MYHIQEAYFTPHGLKGHRCHHRAAAARCDESRRHRVGADCRRHRRRSGLPLSAFRTARSWTAGRRSRPAPSFKMSPILEPLAPFRKHLTIVSGLAQQARRNARAPRLHRVNVADLRQALGPRHCRSGRRRHRRPDCGAPYRSGHAAAFARTHDRAGRRARWPGERRHSRCRRKAIRARCFRSCSARATPTRNARRFLPKPAASSIASRRRPRGCRPASASATASS